MYLLLSTSTLVYEHMPTHAMSASRTCLAEVDILQVSLLITHKVANVAQVSISGCGIQGTGQATAAKTTETATSTVSNSVTQPIGCM